MKFEKGNQIGRRWQPGQSGNPKGRPRIKELREAAKRLMQSAAEDGSTKAESVILRIYENVMSNKPSDAVHWARLLVEITDGKPGRDDDDILISDGNQTGSGSGHEENA
jgi:hypothetical protein